MFGGLGGAARARGGQPRFETEDFAAQQAPPARDLEAMLNISLEDAANGATKRLHLPTGKEVDVILLIIAPSRGALAALGPASTPVCSKRKISCMVITPAGAGDFGDAGDAALSVGAAGS